MYLKLSITNILILLSLISTILVFYIPELYIFWVNNFFLRDWIYYIYVIQFFTGTFLHGSFFHFWANALFLFFFWNILELIMWKNKFIFFFLFITLFDWIGLSLLSNWNTIWISWFCMALISYYTLELKFKNNPEYKWWITALIINIWIGLIPWISLLWHLLWAIWGILYYFLNKKFLKLQFVWEIKNIKS